MPGRSLEKSRTIKVRPEGIESQQRSEGTMQLSFPGMGLSVGIKAGLQEKVRGGNRDVLNE